VVHQLPGGLDLGGHVASSIPLPSGSGVN
jgi:hypothetical protein